VTNSRTVGYGSRRRHPDNSALGDSIAHSASSPLRHDIPVQVNVFINTNKYLMLNTERHL